jgi:hypothetical protein
MRKEHKYSSKSKKFGDEDSLRVARLREEIVARITEISLIMARTLDQPPPSPISEFLLTVGSAGEPLAMSAFKTSSVDTATGKVEIITWGCVCHTNKVCCSDPDCPPCP